MYRFRKIFYFVILLLTDAVGMFEPEYFASTSRRRVNCRTSSDGIASMATSY
jgi:hypothetical protein